MKKFIFPWFKGQISYYPILLQKHVEFYTYSHSNHIICENGVPRIKRIIFEPLWSWFLEATQCLGRQGYELLKNAFTAWATPQAQLYLTELTKMIDPNLYDQIVGLYEKRRRKGYAEKASETAEPKTEENTNVDSVGPF